MKQKHTMLSDNQIIIFINQSVNNVLKNEQTVDLLWKESMCRIKCQNTSFYIEYIKHDLSIDLYLFVTKSFLIQQLIQELQKTFESHEIHIYTHHYARL